MLRKKVVDGETSTGHLMKCGGHFSCCCYVGLHGTWHWHLRKVRETLETSMFYSSCDLCVCVCAATWTSVRGGGKWMANFYRRLVMAILFRPVMTMRRRSKEQQELQECPSNLCYNPFGSRGDGTLLLLLLLLLSPSLAVLCVSTLNVNSRGRRIIYFFFLF